MCVTDASGVMTQDSEQSPMGALSLYNLTVSRYKPRRAEAVPDEDPAELMREVLTIEREITAGLEKLLAEVK